MWKLPLGNYSLKAFSVLGAYDDKTTTMTINGESYSWDVTSEYRNKGKSKHEVNQERTEKNKWTVRHI